jgi:hypothetical protein
MAPVLFLTKKLADANREIERLRAALTTIRDWYIDHPDDAEMMAKFAEKTLALEQNGDGDV